MENPLQPNGVCDSRDLIEYKEHLENQILEQYTDWAENHNETCEEGQEIEVPDDFESIEFINEEAFTETCNELIEEYEGIKDLCDELDYGDFKYGESIIGRNYFEEYCEEFCKDMGYISSKLPGFIENAIDWGKVADEMEMDYMTVTFDGNDYLMRA